MVRRSHRMMTGSNPWNTAWQHANGRLALLLLLWQVCHHPTTTTTTAWSVVPTRSIHHYYHRGGRSPLSSLRQSSAPWISSSPTTQTSVASATTTTTKPPPHSFSITTTTATVPNGQSSSLTLEKMVPLTLAVASDFAGVPGQCIANIGSSRSTESSVSLVVASDESLEPQQQQKDLYVVLGLLWMVAAVSALDRVAMSVAIVSMAQEVSFLPETIKGSISSLFSVGYGLGIVPAGLLLSVASPRMVLAGGLALWSVATLLTPTAADSMMRVLLVVDNTGSSGGGDLAIMNPLALLWPVLLVRALVGVGESMVLPTFHRLLAVWTTSEQKGSALAFLHSGFHAGTIGAYLVSPLVMDSLGGWRALFMTYGCMGLVLLGPWLWLAQDSPQQTSLITRPTQSSNSFLATSSSADSWNGIKDAPWLDFAQSRGAWGMLLAHCARNWGLYTMLAWLPTFYAEQYGLGVRDSAWLSVMPSVAGAAGGFLAGSLADRIVRNLRDPTDEQSVTFVRKVFQSVGLLGPAVVLASLAYHIPDQAWTAQLFFMAAVGLQSFNAGGFEAANQDKAGPKWAGMLYSVTSLPAVMLGTMGVYATGVVLDQTHDFSLVYYINAGINVLGAIAFISLYDSKREFD